MNTMDVKELYGFILLIVITVILLAVGVLTVDKMAQTNLTPNAVAVLGNSTEALTPISNTWLTVIVTVAMAAIILKLVISGFGGGTRR